MTAHYELPLEHIDNLTQSGNVVLRQVAIQCAYAMREVERKDKALAGMYDAMREEKRL